jgi:hypothetical protein
VVKTVVVVVVVMAEESDEVLDIYTWDCFEW